MNFSSEVRVGRTSGLLKILNSCGMFWATLARGLGLLPLPQEALPLLTPLVPQPQLAFSS